MQTVEPRRDYGKLQLLIDGAWTDSGTEDFRDAYNPATGEVIGRIPFALPEEVGRAAESAQRAFEKWRYVPIIERIKYLFKLKNTMETHLEELATVNTQNHGKTLEESRGDMRRAIENVEVAIGAAYILAKGDTLDQIAPGIDVSMSKEPLGVFTVICPFNFPVMIPFWFLPYAVVLGDTVVIKPSDITPLPMQWVAKLIHEEVGLPPGVLNVVHGGKDVVEGLIAHRDVKGVTFVGSSPVAKRVYQLAGEHGKRAIANGGAKNSVVILPDADLDASMANIVSSFFGNAGQRCLAGANLLAVGESHDAFLDKFATATSRLKVGYGLEPGTQMGPLVSERARERVRGYVDTGLAEGARAVTDGRSLRVSEHPNGFYLGATILDDVSPEMKVSKEEVFGPLASVIREPRLEDAIDTINSGTGFGNMACIYTSSGRSAREFRVRVDAGNIGINIGVAAPSAYYPFGGRKDSFYGVLHAQIDTVDFFTDKKIAISKW
jgi:malonate-semialdehyde dehydrogenase (acetylating) / methylmalonate-semialdehyde dehydrogenase